MDDRENRRDASLPRDVVLAPLVLVGCLLLVAAFMRTLPILGYDPSLMKAARVDPTPLSLLVGLVISGMVLAIVLGAQWAIHGLPLGRLGFAGEFHRNFASGLLLGLAMSLTAKWIKAWMAETSSLTLAVPQETAAWVVLGYYGMFLLFMVLGCFCEELLFRAYPLEKYADQPEWIAFAVLGTSFLFAVFHHTNESFAWEAFFTRFLMGVLLALLFLTSRSIWAVVGLHTGLNWGAWSFTGNWKVGGLYEWVWTPASQAGNLLHAGMLLVMIGLLLGLRKARAWAFPVTKKT